MKYMGRLGYVFVIGISLFLVGCSSLGQIEKDRKEIMSLTSDYRFEEGGKKIEAHFKYVDDEILMQRFTYIFSYEMLGIMSVEEDKEQYLEEFESMKAGYNEVKGVSFDYEYQESDLVQSLSVDYEKGDFDEIVTVLGKYQEGFKSPSYYENKWFSMTSTELGLLESGFVKL